MIAGVNTAGELSIGRVAFLDLVSGRTSTDSGRLATLIGDVTAARAVATISDPTGAFDTTVLWMGPTHTAVATGHDPLQVRRIRTANTPLAVVGLLGLRRITTTPQTDRSRAGWWRIQLDDDGSTVWEMIDRSPAGTWLVTDEGSTTRVEPVSLRAVMRKICDTLAPVIAPI